MRRVVLLRLLLAFAISVSAQAEPPTSSQASPSAPAWSPSKDTPGTEAPAEMNTWFPELSPYTTSNGCTSRSTLSASSSSATSKS